jgi:hypothetical protein
MKNSHYIRLKGKCIEGEKSRNLQRISSWKVVSKKGKLTEDIELEGGFELGMRDVRLGEAHGAGPNKPLVLRGKQK